MEDNPEATAPAVAAAADPESFVEAPDGGDAQRLAELRAKRDADRAARRAAHLATHNADAPEPDAPPAAPPRRVEDGAPGAAAATFFTAAEPARYPRTERRWCLSVLALPRPSRGQCHHSDAAKIISKSVFELGRRRYPDVDAALLSDEIERDKAQIAGFEKRATSVLEMLAECQRKLDEASALEDLGED